LACALDSGFPELPSSSQVLELFGGDWKKYSGAVTQAREKAADPSERIGILLRAAHSVNEVETAIASEFSGIAGVDSKYKQKGAGLRQAIEERLEEIRERARVRAGALSTDVIEARYSTLEAIANTRISRFKLYNGARKSEKRAVIAEDVLSMLVQIGPQQMFAYLGLEGVNFGSYIVLHQLLPGLIDPSASLIAECDCEAAMTMQSIVANYRLIEGGEVFEDLQVEKSYLHKALTKSKGCFDVANFDFKGGWSKTKEAAIKTLFRKKQLSPQALLYVTLLNSEVERGRVRNGTTAGGICRKGYGTADQAALLVDCLAESAQKNGYSHKIFRAEEYFDTQPMLFFGVSVERLAIVSDIKVEKEKTLIISIGQDREAIKLAEKLRSQDGNVVIYYGKPSKALEYANSKKIKKVIFVGKEEVEKGKFKVKDMDSGGEKFVKV